MEDLDIARFSRIKQLVNKFKVSDVDYGWGRF